MATEPESEMEIMPASVSWTPSANFAMILADGSKEQADVGLDAANETVQTPEPIVDEDERRRQRLRDLLGDDADMSPPRSTHSGRTPTDPRTENRDALAAGADEKGVFAKPFIETRLPEIESGRFVLPPVRAVSIDQKPIGNGKVPETVSSEKDLQVALLPEDGYSRLSMTNGGAWPHLCRPWAAPNTFSHPLYFEDRMLERHGHERWGYLQPLASGTRFFATLPMLPYLATIQPPCDIVYSKGYYRAGSPAPKLWQRPPLEQRAVIVEAAVISGQFIALP